MYPGLIIFIIDQSEIMNNQYGTSTSIETASVLVNTFISDLCLRCLCGEQIKRWAYIVVIGHEEDFNSGVNILLSGWIDDIANQGLESVKTDSSQIEQASNEYLEFVTLQTNGIHNFQLNALELACHLLTEWKGGTLMNRNIAHMPVPLLLNISSGTLCNTEIYDGLGKKVTEMKDRIDSIVMPDGSPLICNIILDKESTPSMFPHQCPSREEEAYLFNLSSTIPKTLINYYNLGYAYGLNNSAWLKGKERLLLSNMPIDKIKAFCSSLIGFYTHEWCGMCVGHPNNLLDE